MEKPLIYRRRFIPDELILLKDDEILLYTNEVIVTKWKVLRPRKDFAKGYSCYFLKKGFKISKFLDKDGKLVYYYCDIIETQYEQSKNAFTFVDLLADVIVYEDGFVKVVDLGEIPEALDKGLLSVARAKKALKRLDRLLEIIYAGGLQNLIKEYFTDDTEEESCDRT